MPSIGKLTHEHKMKITYLYEKGWKTSAIKRELEVEKIAVSWNAVKKVINNHVQGNFRPHEKVEKDRPAFKALTAKDLNLIHATLRKDCNTSARELWRILRNEGTEVSLSTVRKAIKAAGFTAAKPRYCQLIKEKNKIDRVTFCTGIISENDKFDDTIFSDECTIQLHDNKSVTYHEIGAAAPNHCKPKHPLKIHLWGAISKQGPSNLLVFDGIMDSVFYVEGCLKEGLLPFVNNFFPGGHRFIQDNDPKHRSKISKQFMAENGINWFSAWPSESPDLNPIEMVWNMLKRHVSRRNPTTKDQLSHYCREFWDHELTPEVCTRFIEHNYKVVPLTVKLAGKATGDLPKKIFRESSAGKDVSYFADKLETGESEERFGRLTFHW